MQKKNKLIMYNNIKYRRTTTEKLRKIKYRSTTTEKLRNIENKLHLFSKKLEVVEKFNISEKKSKKFEQSIVIETEFFNNSFSCLKKYLNLLEPKKNLKKKKKN